MGVETVTPGETKFPLTLKDIISMVTIAVTLTLAWGVFGTRLTVVEKEIINVNATLKEHKDMIKSNELKIAGDEARIRDLEGTVEDLWKAKRTRH